ncbi:hypothetical protein ABK040_006306 [Willaertia magna]
MFHDTPASVSFNENKPKKTGQPTTTELEEQQQSDILQFGDNPGILKSENVGVTVHHPAFVNVELEDTPVSPALNPNGRAAQYYSPHYSNDVSFGMNSNWVYLLEGNKYTKLKVDLLNIIFPGWGHYKGLNQTFKGESLMKLSTIIILSLLLLTLVGIGIILFFTLYLAWLIIVTLDGHKLAIRKLDWKIPIHQGECSNGVIKKLSEIYWPKDDALSCPVFDNRDMDTVPIEYKKMMEQYRQA